MASTYLTGKALGYRPVQNEFMTWLNFATYREAFWMRRILDDDWLQSGDPAGRVLQVAGRAFLGSAADWPAWGPGSPAAGPWSPISAGPRAAAAEQVQSLEAERRADLGEAGDEPVHGAQRDVVGTIRAAAARLVVEDDPLQLAAEFAA